MSTLLAAASQYMTYILLGGLVVVMIFFTIIPQKKKQKQMAEMMNQLSVGHRVKTIGGFYGKVVSLDGPEGTIVINIGKDDKEPVLVNIMKQGIYQNMDLMPVPKKGTELDSDNNDNNDSI